MKNQQPIFSMAGAPNQLCGSQRVNFMQPSAQNAGGFHGTSGGMMSPNAAAHMANIAILKDC